MKILSELDGMSHATLVAEAKARGIPANQSSDNLRAAIREQVEALRQSSGQVSSSQGNPSAAGEGVASPAPAAGDGNTEGALGAAATAPAEPEPSGEAGAAAVNDQRGEDQRPYEVTGRIKFMGKIREPGDDDIWMTPDEAASAVAAGNLRLREETADKAGN